MFPNLFKARMNKLLGKENKVFLKYCQKPLRITIRINKLKVENENRVIEGLKRYGWKLERIPFLEGAYEVKGLKKEEAIGNTLEFFLGYYYVQEIASMLPPLILNPEPGERVLDLCASPGSKTTQLAMIMENKGLIIANDVTLDRLKILKYNLEKYGILNAVTTLHDGRFFWKKGLEFDKILVDAPCSCEGVIRKNYQVLSRWSIGRIKELSKLQKGLIFSAFKCLREGGILVYSTCTLAPEENEEVVSFLLEKFENATLEKIEIPGFKMREGIPEWNGKRFREEVKNCSRIYPQDNNTEAFFIAKIRKL